MTALWLYCSVYWYTFKLWSMMVIMIRIMCTGKIIIIYFNIDIIIYDIPFNYHFLLWSKIPNCTTRISMIWRSSVELLWVPAVIYSNGNEYVAIINWVIFQWWVVFHNNFIYNIYGGYNWKNPYFDCSKEREGFQKFGLFASIYISTIIWFFHWNVTLLLLCNAQKLMTILL